MTGKIFAASAASMVASNPVVSATIIGWSILETANQAPRPTKKVARLAMGGLIAFAAAQMIGTGGTNCFLSSFIPAVI